MDQSDAAVTAPARQGAQENAASGEAADEAASQPNFVAFRVMGQDYCLDILAVREISQRIHITPLPQSPVFISGVINLRGSVVPVLDCQVRFGLTPAGRALQGARVAPEQGPDQTPEQTPDQGAEQGPEQGPERGPERGAERGPERDQVSPSPSPLSRQVIIVVQIGARTLGLLVDEVTEILNIPHSAIKAIPESDEAAATPLVSGVIVKDSRIIRHIDLAQVVPEKELAAA